MALEAVPAAGDGEVREADIGQESSHRLAQQLQVRRVDPRAMLSPKEVVNGEAAPDVQVVLRQVQVLLVGQLGAGQEHREPETLSGLHDAVERVLDRAVGDRDRTLDAEFLGIEVDQEDADIAFVAALRVLVALRKYFERKLEGLLSLPRVEGELGRAVAGPGVLLVGPGQEVLDPPVDDAAEGGLKMNEPRVLTLRFKTKGFIALSHLKDSSFSRLSFASFTQL